jgi:uncharacterized protein YjeT (DUF2065 family)
MRHLICVIGMVLVIEGLPYMTYPEWTKSYLRKIMDIPNLSLRLLGLTAVSIGLLLLFFGTRG